MAKKAVCSCHPETFAQRIREALDAETAAILTAAVFGVALGVCGCYAWGHVRVERHRLSAAPIQVPSCAESGNCTPVLATLGGTAIDIR